MGRIDTSGWMEFQIKDIFEIKLKGNKIQVPTGASIPMKDLVENGSTPRITVTGVNNGICGTFDYCGKKPSDYRVFNNFISVSFLGTVFYQENNASLDMKVHCLRPKEVILNRYTGQFLVAAIKASLRESTYADQISSSILPEMTIKLPVAMDGSPDWTYMEHYMLNLETTVSGSLVELQSAKNLEKHKVDISRWKKYHLYDDMLFDIDMGTKMDKSKMSSIHPTVNFVGRANTNNGVTMCVDKTSDIPYKAGYLTLSLGGEYLGSCFIQNKEFYTSQNVVVLIPKWNMSDAIKQYIATIIFKEARLYYKAFSDELNRHIKKDFSFYLPTLNGQPDWNYMEQYMNNIESRVSQTLDSLSIN